MSALHLKPSTSDEQAQYLHSVNDTEDAYRAALGSVAQNPSDPQSAPLNSSGLPNLDFDTVKPTAEGEYKLADETYAFLVEHLAQQKSATPPALLTQINSFYSNPLAADALKSKDRRWAKLQGALAQIKTAPATAN